MTDGIASSEGVARIGYFGRAARVSDNPLVSLAPVALIFPAFAECRGLP